MGPDTSMTIMVRTQDDRLDKQHTAALNECILDGLGSLP
jgi:hypothetical protein